MLFSPGTVIASDLPAAEPATTETTSEPAKTQVPTPPAQPSQPEQPKTQVPSLDAKALLDAINADRETREARIRADQERDSFKKRAEDAEARWADFEKSKKNTLLNPAGFFKKLGYNEQQQALIAEGIMFALMPDKAPPGHVAKLVQAQREQDLLDQEEREKQRQVDEAKRATESQTQQERQLESRYVAALKRDVTSFKPGMFPASQAWFADDHDAYTQELFATARDLAAKLTPGQTMDITTAGVAPIVEKKYMERAQRLASVFNSRPQTDTTQQTKTQVQDSQARTQSTAQQAESNSSNAKTRYLSDKDLIDAAVKAAFGA
jgi:hypothetical protein